MYKAGSSRITIGSAINMDKIALDVNYTMDMLTQMQPLNRVSVGIRLDLGDRGRKLISGEVDELYLLGLDAFAVGNYADARLCFEEALRINPRFDPAKEALLMLDHREALIQRIDEVYRLNY